MGEPTKQLKTTLRSFTAVIILTVLCGILATVGSVVYTTWANDQQDQKMCRLLRVFQDPNAPPPDTERAKTIAEGLERYKHEIHCL